MLDYKKASRELTLRWIEEIEKKYVLSEHHQSMKEVFSSHSFQELNQGGKCWLCKSPAKGHFYEECVIRTHGTITHLYRRPSMKGEQNAK